MAACFTVSSLGAIATLRSHRSSNSNTHVLGARSDVVLVDITAWVIVAEHFRGDEGHATQDMKDGVSGSVVRGGSGVFPDFDVVFRKSEPRRGHVTFQVKTYIR